MMCVNQLLMIAGPSGVGKTTLIERLQEGNLPSLCEKLELGDTALWKYVTIKELLTITDSMVDQMLLEYNLNRVWKSYAAYGYIDERHLQILDTSKEIILITLWASPETLRHRIITRTVKGLFWTFGLNSIHLKLHILRSFHKTRKRYRLYKNPHYVYSLYSEWFTFCKRRKLKAHWIIDTTKRDPRIISFEQLMRDINGNVKNIQFL